MNFLKVAQILAISVGIMVLFAACGESASTTNQATTTEETQGQEEAHDHADGHDHEHSHGTANASHGEGEAYTAAYVCPMHCEGSGSDAPGTCPVCNMNYVAQADHVADGHTHEE